LTSGETPAYLAGTIQADLAEMGVVSIGATTVQPGAVGAFSQTWLIQQGEFVEIYGTVLDGVIVADTIVAQ
jgi:hypothetical protein